LHPEEVTISGLPWLAAGERKVVPLSALVGRCLCAGHNSDLSPLDAAGARLAAAVRDLAVNAERSRRLYLFSGHDIERWLLKAFLSMAHTKNFGTEGAALKPEFESSFDYISMLEDPLAWVPGAGLYIRGRTGDRFAMKEEFEFAPLISEAKRLVGMLTNLAGFQMAFFPAPPPSPPGQWGAYRLQTFKIQIS
jgi:hypothetical protein